MTYMSDRLEHDAEGEEHEQIDVTVLDLPQLYQKPSASLLLSTLEDLSVGPPSWAANAASASNGASVFQMKRRIKSEGIPAYLTKIVGSSLQWIDDEDAKERIWEVAAQRLSERSGRTGMGNMTRVFEIPIHQPAAGGDDLNGEKKARPHETVSITLHEPALSEDNLGLKTWAASYLLAKRLPLLKAHFPSLSSPASANTPCSILELGSGTGLVGLAASAVLASRVVLTDLPTIVPNLRRNVQANAAVLASHEGSAQTAILDWTDPGKVIFDSDDSPDMVSPHSFGLLLAADPIYSPSHPKWLVDAIEYHLSKGSDARVVIELPLREGFESERSDLRARVVDMGLKVMGEGEESGYDDWGDEDGLTEVRCWWGVWGWAGDEQPRENLASANAM